MPRAFSGSFARDVAAELAEAGQIAQKWRLAGAREPGRVATAILGPDCKPDRVNRSGAG